MSWPPGLQLQGVGKRQSRELEAYTSGVNDGHQRAIEQSKKRQPQHFIVTYKKTGIDYIVDSGAMVSVMPSSREDRTKPPLTDESLTGLDGGIIKVYGDKTLELDLGLGKIASSGKFHRKKKLH